MLGSVWGAETFAGLHDGVVRGRSGSQTNPKALAPFFSVVAELSPRLWKIFSGTFYVASCLFKRLFKFGSQANMAESNQVSTRLFRGGMP
jgi:hypothetical protein